MKKFLKKAQEHEIVLWLVILAVSVVLIITLYYALTGRLAGLKPRGL